MPNKTKNKIELVALELFATGGFHSTSIRDISSVAGVNVASINYHFKSKEALYRGLMVPRYEALTKRVSEIDASKMQDALEEFYRVMLSFVENGKQANWLKIVIWEDVRASNVLNEERLALSIACHNKIKEVVHLMNPKITPNHLDITALAIGGMGFIFSRSPERIARATSIDVTNSEFWDWELPKLLANKASKMIGVLDD